MAGYAPFARQSTMPSLAYPQLIYMEVKLRESSVPAELNLPAEAEELLAIDVRDVVPSSGVEREIVRELEAHREAEEAEEEQRREARAAVEAAAAEAEASAVAAAAAAAAVSGSGVAAAAAASQAARLAQEEEAAQLRDGPAPAGASRDARLQAAHGQGSSSSYSASNPFLRPAPAPSSSGPFVGNDGSQPPPSYSQLSTSLAGALPGAAEAAPKPPELARMMSFTGADEDTARYYLEETDFDVQKAAQNFWDHKATMGGTVL